MKIAKEKDLSWDQEKMLWQLICNSDDTDSADFSCQAWKSAKSENSHLSFQAREFRISTSLLALFENSVLNECLKVLFTAECETKKTKTVDDFSEHFLPSWYIMSSLSSLLSKKEQTESSAYSCSCLSSASKSVISEEYSLLLIWEVSELVLTIYMLSQQNSQSKMLSEKNADFYRDNKNNESDTESDNLSWTSLSSTSQPSLSTMMCTLSEMHYVTSMSYSDSFSTPFFDDYDVSDFLKRYSDLCEDCDNDEAEKCQQLSHYCKSSIETYIKTSLKWVNSNWAELIKTLQKKYEIHNLEQQIRL